MDSKARLLFSTPGWPSLIDLKCGGALTFERKGRAWSIGLVSVRAELSHDWRPSALPGNKTIREVKALVEIDGRQRLLRLAPCEPPTLFQGLRLQLEKTKALDSANASSKGDFHFDARISATLENEPWAPLSFHFPLPSHRWRMNPCYGLWGGLLCGDSSRFAEGFNLGVSEGDGTVVAALEGYVKEIKPRKGAPEFSRVVLEHLNGVKTVYSNLDSSSLPFALSVNKTVEAGERLGEIRACFDEAPHLAFSMEIEGSNVNPFPALAEAYMRQNPDGALPYAGGTIFCQPGEAVKLDASSTLLRPGRRIASCEWALSDGAVRQGGEQSVVYKEPGLYAEELRIALDDGQEFRDAVHVRVFKPNIEGQAAFPGWLHLSSKAGGTTAFKAIPRQGFVFERIEFGDGSQGAFSDGLAEHSYSKPGIYTVDAKGCGPDGAPFTLKRFVKAG